MRYRSGISRLGIKYQLSNRQVREIVILLFFFLVLREFLIPYFKYTPYVTLLLGITEHISSWFGHPGYIEGDQLIGEFGTLGLSKHCLGFMSFYLFASFVFLTRENLPGRVTALFITARTCIPFHPEYHPPCGHIHHCPGSKRN